MTPSKSTKITHWLKQTAVYWGNPTYTATGGRTFDDPVELDCRWEQRSDMFRDAQGNEVHSNAIVFVNSDVVVGGWLYLGELDDLSSSEEADPQTVDDAYEIRRFDKIPDYSGTYVRQVYL